MIIPNCHHLSVVGSVGLSWEEISQVDWCSTQNRFDRYGSAQWLVMNVSVGSEVRGSVHHSHLTHMSIVGSTPDDRSFSRWVFVLQPGRLLWLKGGKLEFAEFIFLHHQVWLAAVNFSSGPVGHFADSVRIKKNESGVECEEKVCLMDELFYKSSFCGPPISQSLCAPHGGMGPRLSGSGEGKVSWFAHCVVDCCKQAPCAYRNQQWL